jgi:uncharacterized YccA/Bax inhibitor family protein
VRSSNPVLTRLGQEPAQPQTYGPGTSPSSSYPYPSPVLATADTGRMTIDDVVVRTVALLAVTAISGGVAWSIVPNRLLGPVLIGGALVGVVIGLVISFKRITNPPLILTYAVIEGVFVGLFSKVFESIRPGIILQAVLGTFGIFLVMAMLYKFRVIRNSPRFTRIMIGALTGVFVVIFGNFLLSMFGITTGLRGDGHGNGSTLSIVFSLVVIVVAALTFILDFDLIEQSVAAGAPRSMAWTCAFGLLVGLIWVYLEVLRLLSYLRGR